MPTTKSIPGIQRGPDFDREVHEVARTERLVKEVKLGRQTEANDPLIQAAVEAVEEIGAADELGREYDVQYDRNSGVVVFTVYAADGETVIRRIPPEEAIRMAQHRKHRRSQLLSQTF